MEKTRRGMDKSVYNAEIGHNVATFLESLDEHNSYAVLSGSKTPQNASPCLSKMNEEINL
jgi:hypothetical protein